ncbi:MAG: chemotaxis protein [Planctomycetota bacterium]|nr:MAG: chemotaxis protein [Planctomycetota bacterium]
MLDLTTIIGLLVGVAAIVLGVMDAGGQAGYFVNLGAIGIILGGTCGATIAQFPWSDLVEFPRVVGKLLFHRAGDPIQIVRDFVRYAEIARKDGILALEGVAEEIRDPFVVRGLQLAIDGTDPEVIQAMLTTELEGIASGTLTGMIVMMKSMNNPNEVGPGMSQALCATLYGTIGCYVFANPLAKKLEIRSREELIVKEMVIKGILAIQSGDNPRIVEQKLRLFLPPRLREQMESERA